MGKSIKIPHHILRFRRSLCSGGRNPNKGLPPDVPHGHVAVSVGITCRRFVFPAIHLNHPVFRRLLRLAEEEYGFGNYSGPLAIPCCDESLFEEILIGVSRGESSKKLLRLCEGRGTGVVMNEEEEEEEAKLW